MTVSFSGSDILLGASHAGGVAGLTTLGVTAGNAPASRAASKNPYQQSYDSIESWSAGYLESSALFGPQRTVPEYTAGTSVSGFASLANLLAEIKTGITSGTYGGGSGFDAYA